MRMGDLLENRRQSWARLDQLCRNMEGRRASKQKPEVIAEFAALYRAACSDLAMADTYQLPASTVEYLHRLVGRAHARLYRPERTGFHKLIDYVTYEIPQTVFGDFCVHFCTLIFFGLFLGAATAAYWQSRFPGFATQIVGNEQLRTMEEMYEEPLDGNLEHYISMSSFYIYHNTGIGLSVFGTGPTIIWPICTLGYNAVQLGTVFGYMARPDVDSGKNFFEFVTAHGPFELSAIALSAGAGLRLGIGLITTAGYRRLDSMRIHGLRALPTICCSVMLFVGAAFTEGFISPSPLPYITKVLWAALASTALMFYFVVLGFPGGKNSATR